MLIAPLVDRVSLVVAGHINPAIFSPHWLCINNLIGRSEADHAKVELIHPELCRFEVGEFTVQATPQQFVVSCSSIRHEMARDLALSIFGQLLTHTPILAIGINRELHFDVGSFSIRERVGERLAPKSAWGKWSEQISGPLDGSIGHGGMARIAMQQGRVGETFSGFTVAEVQPSAIPSLSGKGIYMYVNAHYIPKDNDQTSVYKPQLIEVLETGWTEAIEKSMFIVDQIQTLVKLCAVGDI